MQQQRNFSRDKDERFNESEWNISPNSVEHFRLPISLYPVTQIQFSDEMYNFNFSDSDRN